MVAKSNRGRKRSKLSEADKFYVDNHPDLSDEDLMSIIKCSTKSIHNYRLVKQAEAEAIEVARKEKEQNDIANEVLRSMFVPEKPKDHSTCQTDAGNHEDSPINLYGRRKGSVVATPASSEQSNPKTVGP